MTVARRDAEGLASLRAVEAREFDKAMEEAGYSHRYGARHNVLLGWRLAMKHRGMAIVAIIHTEKSGEVGVLWNPEFESLPEDGTPLYVLARKETAHG